MKTKDARANQPKSTRRRRSETSPRLTKPQQRIERIYQELRRQICLLDLPPGLVLREQDLADRFSVSRTPIRHVLGRLAGDELVESRQGVGTTVTTLHHSDLFDIYYVRATLAEAIGDSGPEPATPQTLQAMEALAARCDGLMSRRDVRTFGEINIELHTHLFSIVRSRPLRELSDRLFFQTARIWFQVLPHLSWREAVRELHQEIDQSRRAMLRGDLKAVGLIHRNHLFTVLAMFQQLIDDNDGNPPWQ